LGTAVLKVAVKLLPKGSWLVSWVALPAGRTLEKGSEVSGLEKGSSREEFSYELSWPKAEANGSLWSLLNRLVPAGEKGSALAPKASLESLVGAWKGSEKGSSLAFSRSNGSPYL
jgi:hypothetical protein